MQVSRCRYWWCPRCKAVFAKEELQNRTKLFADQDESQILGTRTCAHCSSVYHLRDIYAGRHDVPRQFWSQLQPPVELEQEEGTRRRARPVATSLASSLTAWSLFLLAGGGGLVVLGYVLVRPLLAQP